MFGVGLEFAHGPSGVLTVKTSFFVLTGHSFRSGPCDLQYVHFTKELVGRATA